MTVGEADARELLRILTSRSNVPDVIRQFLERGDERMVEVLTDLEADEPVERRIMT